MPCGKLRFLLFQSTQHMFGESPLAVLRPAHGESRTAFTSQEMTVNEEYGVSSDPSVSGCRVPKVSLSIHCTQPHLETVAHCLPAGHAAPYLSEMLPNGCREATVLITPPIETLKQCEDSYEAGSPQDYVISRRALTKALQPYSATPIGSIIVRIPSEYLPTRGSEIIDWPYLTSEAADYLRSVTSHYRTNAPSVERKDSKGEFLTRYLQIQSSPL